MTTNQLFRELKSRIEACYEGHEADAIALMVMEEVLHYSRVDVLLRGDVEQDEVFANRIRHIAQRLCDGEPIQYILGHTTFHGHSFRLTPATLIPRPETEHLVDIIVDDAGGEADLRVLDIGTGSGCIAITLALETKAKVTAWDIAEEALMTAKANAEALKANVIVERKNVFETNGDERRWDVIVSNPPYICEKEKAHMESNVLDHEPSIALFVPDSDPLLFYRAITRYASSSLNKGGRLFFEINPLYAKEMEAMAEEEGFINHETREDQYGKARMMKIWKE